MQYSIVLLHICSKKGIVMWDIENTQQNGLRALERDVSFNFLKDEYLSNLSDLD